MFLQPSLTRRQAAFATPLVARPFGSSTLLTSSWCSPYGVTAKLPTRKRFHLAYASAVHDEGTSQKLMKLEPTPVNGVNPTETSTRRIGLIATASATTKEEKTTSEESVGSVGFLGVKAKAYWKSIGWVPVIFAGLGVLALTIKMVKVVRGRWKSSDGVNRAMINDSVITTAEQEAELHVFKCGGCGYEIYPARGREFKFFPDNFKCPLCGSPKSAFWDRNDPTDPRNQESDDDEEDEDLQPAGVKDPNLSGGAPLPGDGSGTKKD